MDIPKWHPNERVDIDDVDFLSAGVVRESRRTTRDVLSGSRLRILNGFGFTVLGGDTTLRITKGAAIGASGLNGVVEAGQIISEGAAFQDVAFAAFGAATISVWIKFQYADGGSANRKFYDKATDKEKTLLTKTKQIAGWIAQASPTSPGAEWVQLFSVAWDGAGFSTSVITDARYFLFEGKANAAPAFKSDWGGGLDRNADRATNGVKTLDRFAAAVIKKIEELQSSTSRWWEATAEPLDRKVSRDGDMSLTGGYSINGTLHVDTIITVAGSIIADSIAQALALWAMGSVGTGNPDPDVASLLLLQNTNTANNAKAPAFWLHSAVDGGRDGVVAYSKRIAEDDVDFILATIVDSAFGADKFIFDMDVGVLTLGGGTSIGANLILGGTATINGGLVSLDDNGDVMTSALFRAMNQRTMPKAWGTVHHATAAGGTLSAKNGANIATITYSSIPNGLISVAFAQAMANGNYAVLASLHPPSNTAFGVADVGVVSVESKTGAGFDLRIRHYDGGTDAYANVDLAALGPFDLDFLVFAQQ